MLYRIFIFTILLYTVLYLVLFISRFQDPRHRVQFPALRVATRRLCRYATFWVQWNHSAPCSEKWSTAVAERYEKRQTIVPTSPFPHQMHPVLAKRQKREMCQLRPALLIVCTLSPSLSLYSTRRLHCHRTPQFVLKLRALWHIFRLKLCALWHMSELKLRALWHKFELKYVLSGTCFS